MFFFLLLFFLLLSQQIGSIQSHYHGKFCVFHWVPMLFHYFCVYIVVHIHNLLDHIVQGVYLMQTASLSQNITNKQTEIIPTLNCPRWTPPIQPCDKMNSVSPCVPIIFADLVVWTMVQTLVKSRLLRPIFRLCWLKQSLR